MKPDRITIAALLLGIVLTLLAWGVLGLCGFMG